MRHHAKMALGCVVISQALDVAGAWWPLQWGPAAVAILMLWNCIRAPDREKPRISFIGKSGMAKIIMVERPFFGLGDPVTKIYIGRGDGWVDEKKESVCARKRSFLEQMRQDEIDFQRRVRAAAVEVSQTIELIDTLDTWGGGPMPVPRGTEVLVRWRSGHLKADRAGEGFANRWHHTGDSDDIVAWRRAKTTRKSSERH